MNPVATSSRRFAEQVFLKTEAYESSLAPSLRWQKVASRVIEVLATLLAAGFPFAVHFLPISSLKMSGIGLGSVFLLMGTHRALQKSISDKERVGKTLKFQRALLGADSDRPRALQPIGLHALPKDARLRSDRLQRVSPSRVSKTVASILDRWGLELRPSNKRIIANFWAQIYPEAEGWGCPPSLKEVRTLLRRLQIRDEMCYLYEREVEQILAGRPVDKQRLDEHVRALKDLVGEFPEVKSVKKNHLSPPKKPEDRLRAECKKSRESLFFEENSPPKVLHSIKAVHLIDLRWYTKYPEISSVEVKTLTELSALLQRAPRLGKLPFELWREIQAKKSFYANQKLSDFCKKKQGDLVLRRLQKVLYPLRKSKETVQTVLQPMVRLAPFFEWVARTPELKAKKLGELFNHVFQLDAFAPWFATLDGNKSLAQLRPAPIPENLAHVPIKKLLQRDKKIKHALQSAKKAMKKKLDPKSYKEELVVPLKTARIFFKRAASPPFRPLTLEKKDSLPVRSRKVRQMQIHRELQSIDKSMMRVSPAKLSLGAALLQLALMVASVAVKHQLYFTSAVSGVVLLNRGLSFLFESRWKRLERSQEQLKWESVIWSRGVEKLGPLHPKAEPLERLDSWLNLEGKAHAQARILAGDELVPDKINDNSFKEAERYLQNVSLTQNKKLEKKRPSFPFEKPSDEYTKKFAKREELIKERERLQRDWEQQIEAIDMTLYCLKEATKGARTNQEGELRPLVNTLHSSVAKKHDFPMILKLCSQLKAFEKKELEKVAKEMDESKKTLPVMEKWKAICKKIKSAHELN